MTVFLGLEVDPSKFKMSAKTMKTVAVVIAIACVITLIAVVANAQDPASSVVNGRDLLNTCMAGRKHKEAPGREDSLHSHCDPWKTRSCCNRNTTYDVHYGSSYNFNYNHCPGRQISDRCLDHFTRDLCFYECSPNVGPWLVKVNQKIRKERFVNVPLCAIDCEQWFEDCKQEYTCTNNWGRNFVWEDRDKDGKKENHCPEGSECKTFKDMWGTAKNFCENIWDNSWKYTPNPQPCMRIWFDAANGNPNDVVAKWQVNQITAAASSTGPATFLTMILTTGLGLFVL